MLPARHDPLRKSAALLQRNHYSTREPRSVTPAERDNVRNVLQETRQPLAHLLNMVISNKEDLRSLTMPISVGATMTASMYAYLLLPRPSLCKKQHKVEYLKGRLFRQRSCQEAISQSRALNERAAATVSARA